MRLLTPHGQIIMACHTNVSRYFVIHQVAINIVLQDEFRRVKPVVEDLTPHDMSSHTPAYLILFMAQPVMAEYLSVKVVCFEGSVVYVASGPFEEEESVVVDKGIRASINAVKGCDIVARGSMKELNDIVLDLIHGGLNVDPGDLHR